MLSFNEFNEEIISYIDFSYTSITALFLGGLLFRSFEIRRLYAVGFVSLAVIFLAIYGQLLGLPTPPVKVNTLHQVAVFCISHTMMLAIFVSLAFSWVIENAETVKEVKEEEIADSFLRIHEESSAKEIEEALKSVVDRGELYDAIVITKHYFKRKGRILTQTLIQTKSKIYRNQNENNELGF